LPQGRPRATDQLPSRSQAKREAIRVAARDLFLGGGYDGTSMDDVAARARVSKQTVYKHFTDKESLFEDIVLAEIASSEAETRDLLDDLPDRDDFIDGLRAFARRHVNGVLQPSIVALRRTVIAEANRFPQLAHTWWERGPQAGHRTLAEVFSRAADNGHLRPLDDPLLAAQQFNWLVLVPLNAAMLLGPEAIDAEMDVQAVADDAVRVFLAAYGPESA
jgi:TetR/AcrR family transcriptional regulator, mexJK operon transcriptional repressor